MVQAIKVSRNHHGPTVRKSIWAPAVNEPTPSGALVLSTASDFEEFFEPLYSEMSSYHWLIQGALFATPPVWEQSYDEVLDRPRGPEIDEYFAYQVEVTDRNHPDLLWVARPGFVPRYARYLVDDWCQLAGVAAWSGDAKDLLRLAEAEQIALWQLPMVEVWFKNVDAALWQFASKRAGLIERVAANLAQRADIRVEQFDLGS